MYCPEHLIFRSEHLWVWHYQRADVRRQYVTWAEVLNPLRYEVNVEFGKRRLCINSGGKLNRAFSNLTWALYRKKAWHRRNASTRREEVR
ncbi:hypothetical protein ABIA10_001850 [Rhizobium leguminosarum]